MTLPPSITRYSEPVYDDIGMQPDAKGEWVKVSDLETASASLSPAAPAPGVTEALRNLVARLDEVHADKRYESVWAVSQLHVGPYSGPTYTDALNAARAALASTTAEPEGVVVHHHPDNHSSPALDRLVEAAARQFANPFDALRFEVVPAKDEHSPSYVLAVTTINPSGGMNSGTLIELNHNADFRIDDARARWAAAALNAKLSATHEDEESFYDIGKRDGYEEAVQDIDLMTGGDGEYRVAVFLGGGVDEDRHCPDPAAMKARIAERFAALRRPETDKPGVREAALEEAAKVADMFAADHAKSADQFGIDRNRELHNAAKGAAQGVAFAIRALSASPAREEQVTDVEADRRERASKVKPDKHGHRTRFSDSSYFDEVCIMCGATDGFGDKRLDQPCPSPLHHGRRDQ